MRPPDGPEAVYLTVPPESRYLRLARLTAAGIAGELGFSIEEIEDLRIAVDEACAVLIAGEQEAGVLLELVFRVDEGGLVVEGSCDAGGSSAVEVHPVAQELLRMSADEHVLAGGEGRRTFRLVKRRSLAP